MGENATKDLTQGSPSRLIMEFAIPMFFGFLFQQFYSLVDTMIVGQFLGADALAAVGSTGSINFLVIGFCMGVCNGFTIPVAQQFGARKEKELRKYVATGGWLCAAFAVVVTFFTTVFSGQILQIMQTPQDIFADAHTYIFIIFCGIPVCFLYNFLSGIIRSLGDSVTPVVFLALSSGLNIALDIILIYFVHMGVAGAAVATVAAQLISGVLCLFVMKRRYVILQFEEEEWKFRYPYAKRLCAMGIPMGLQYSITAIGGVILQAAVNGLGTIYVAAMSAATRLSCFFSCPYDALGSTMATYAGQNVGAGKIDRIGKGLRSAVTIGTIYSIAAMIVLILFTDKLALLFVSKTEVEIIHNVQVFMTLSCVFYVLLLLVNCIRFLIQGLGFSNFAMIAGICEMAARALIGFVFTPRFGFPAACLGNGIAWVFADAFLIPAYFYCIRKTKQKMNIA